MQMEDDAAAAASRLLNGSRSLQSLIQAETELPPVARSIHQIAEASERMLTSVQAPVAPVAADTYRFLAKQGVDAMALDPSSLELTRAAGATWEGPAAFADAEAELEAFLAGEQSQILHQTIWQANQLTTDEFETAFWARRHEEWEASKPRLLDDLRFESGAYESGAPAAGRGAAHPALGGRAAAPAAPAPHALGRSRTRPPRSLEYTAALAKLCADGGAQSGAPLDLLTPWCAVASAGRVDAVEASSAKLVRARAGRAGRTPAAPA